MSQTLTRRSLVTIAPAAVVVATLPALAAGAHLDADLLVLRPEWIATRARFGAALEALNAAEARFHALRPELPCLAEFDGFYEAYRAEHRRVTAIRDALMIETGVAAARDLDSRTMDADDAVVERIAAIPAQTKEGLQFKREVLKDWEGCERDDLEQSLIEDLLALVGGLDA